MGHTQVAWNVLVTLFGWPNGIVLGNLLASAIWGLPALIHLHIKINRNHKELTADRGMPQTPSK
jgi:hypothetical protein